MSKASKKLEKQNAALQVRLDRALEARNAMQERETEVAEIAKEADAILRAGKAPPTVAPLAPVAPPAVTNEHYARYTDLRKQAAAADASGNRAQADHFRLSARAVAAYHFDAVSAGVDAERKAAAQ